MRTGSEPVQARSPLRLRLGLALFGLVTAAAGAVILTAAGRAGWAVTFAVIAVVAAVDAALVVRHLRQGARYQPGPEVPPYTPVQRK